LGDLNVKKPEQKNQNKQITFITRWVHIPILILYLKQFAQKAEDNTVLIIL
jgi:hypothetical protein